MDDFFLSPASSKSRKTVVFVALLLVYGFGTSALYGLLWRNGYYEALVRLRNEGPHYLPGSSNFILTQYTRIAPLDKLLTLATVMFSNVTDGSLPQLSLYSFHFGGQYLALLVVIAIEGLRSGNQANSLRFFSVWACLMQTASYGCTMPLYGMVHLLTSPVAEEVGPVLLEAASIVKPLEVSTMPLAFMLGYIVPAILMSIPVFPNWLHQWFGGLWQGSPIWSMAIQILLASRLEKRRRARSISQPNSKEPFARGSQSPMPWMRLKEKDLLARTYLFAFVWCVISQIIPLALIVAVHLYPSAFPSSLQEAWTFFNVFVPPPFWSTEKMVSMASGMHDFFLYDQYVGSTAAIIWSSTLYVNSRENRMLIKSWVKLAFVITALSLLTGPVGAVVWLMWERDQKLLSILDNGF